MKLIKYSLLILMSGALALTSITTYADQDEANEASQTSRQEYRQEKRELMREQKRERREMRMQHKQEAMLKRVDTNEDGQVDLNEYLAHAEQRFAKLDSDSNGVITPEEAKASMKRMREEHRAKRKEMREKYKENRK